MLTQKNLIDLYRRRAKRFDVSANLCYLLGFREWKYRKKAIAEFSLGFNSPQLETVAQEVEATIVKIMKEAASG